MHELIIDGKTYISSKRAAEITGYAKDYVGQLCREGRVEARLVGRSWYVLEDSIREHRFGAEEKQIEEKPTEAVWESPRYMVEDAPEMPKVPEKESQEPEASIEEKVAALSDMQEAWKGWFEKKQEEIYEEAIEEAFEIEEKEVVPSIVEEEVSIKTPWSDIQHTVPVQRNYASPEVERSPMQDIRPRLTQAAPSAPISREVRSTRRTPRTESTIVGKAILLSLTGLVIAVTLIGTGAADTYIGTNWANLPIFQYLGGTSVIEK